MRQKFGAITFLIVAGLAAAWLFRASPPPGAQPEIARQRSERDPVVLEVSSYSGGMYCYAGDHLLLRVYASGHAEYDVVHTGSPCQVGSTTSPTRKETEITRGELRAIVGLTRRPDLMAAKEEYAAFVYGTDTYDDMTITLKHEGGEKKILVHNPAVSHPEAREHYPPSLTELIETARRIRSRSGE